MATKPTSDLTFATASITDPVTAQPNKIEPNVTYQTNGWISFDTVPFSWLNYLFNGYYNWQQYFEATTDDILLNNLTIAGDKTYTGISNFTGFVGVNNTTPSARLHLKLGDAGTEPTWNLSADGFILEDNLTPTMQLFTTNAGNAAIGFSDNDARNIGYIAYDHIADSMSIGTSGALALFLDSSQQLGINEGVPSATLHVKKTDAGTQPTWITTDDIIIAESTGDSAFQLFSLNTKKGVLGFSDNNVRNDGAIIYDHVARNMQFTTAGTALMTLSSTGFIGLNEDTPATRLHVKISDAGTQPAWDLSSDGFILEDNLTPTLQMFCGSTGNATIGFSDNNVRNDGSIVYDHVVRSMQITVASVPYVAIKSTGFMGLNEIEPGARLHIKISDGGTQPAWSGTSDGFILEDNLTPTLQMFCGNTGNCTIGFSDNDARSIGYILYDHNSDSMQFGVNSGLKMCIESTGFVGIGETSAQAALHVKLSSAGTDPAWITTSDTLLVESGNDTGIQIFSTAVKIGQLGFSNPGGRNKGAINYNHNTNTLSFIANTTPYLSINSGGAITCAAGTVLTESVEYRQISAFPSTYTETTTQRRTKRVDIGGWNMTGATPHDVPHGLSSAESRTITISSIIVRRDDNTSNDFLDTGASATNTTRQGFALHFDSTIDLVRLTGGIFDNAAYSSTTINRGYIDISYIPD